MILWLIYIEDCVTEEYHPVTRNHEWQKFGACFTNTLPNEEKCKGTATFRSLNSFSRHSDKKAECLGKSHLFCINLLLFACSLFYSWNVKKMAGIKNQAYETHHVPWHSYPLPLSPYFPYAQVLLLFKCFWAHTCEESISWILGWTAREKLLANSKLNFHFLSFTVHSECQVNILHLKKGGGG